MATGVQNTFFAVIPVSETTLSHLTVPQTSAVTLPSTLVGVTYLRPLATSSCTLPLVSTAPGSFSVCSLLMAVERCLGPNAAAALLGCGGSKTHGSGTRELGALESAFFPLQ